VQLNCEVYDLRYESEFNDLPSELSANNRVPVRLKKNVMYLDFPGDMVKMRIVPTMLAKQPVSKARRPSNRARLSEGRFFAGTRVELFGHEPLSPRRPDGECSISSWTKSWRELPEFAGRLLSPRAERSVFDGKRCTRQQLQCEILSDPPTDQRDSRQV
jgi:hypothetical protein